MAEARLQARIHEDAVKARATVFRDETAAVAPEQLKLDEARVKKGRKPVPKTSPKRDSASSPREGSKNCRFCGRQAHPRNECPARQAKCHYCRRLGHFEDVCEKRKRSLSTVHLHAVSTAGRVKFVKVAVNGYDVDFKVDSGAEVTVVPSTFPGAPRSLQEPEGQLTGPGNHPLTVLGTFQATLTWKGKSVVERVYVLPSQDPPLLGFPAIQKLGVVKFVDALSSLNQQSPLHSDIFEGLGELKDEPGVFAFKSALFKNKYKQVRLKLYRVIV
ncbi:uncharacterized protein K02A2.6-like [Ixodes scapularis]|uniref:uncharacterized protein K02A2.6-like n=1 Tax=Ixodes scapularis TaxID=6945 RepID=UPI001C3927E1|nr:uncharacterized protein K02A2.6-like [Ixodes scapularis]